MNSVNKLTLSQFIYLSTSTNTNTEYEYQYQYQNGTWWYVVILHPWVVNIVRVKSLIDLFTVTKVNQ